MYLLIFYKYRTKNVGIWTHASKGEKKNNSGTPNNDNYISFISGFAGKCAEIKVILVGTYAPEPLAPNTNGTNLLGPLLPFLREFSSILGDEPQMVALDATNHSSPGIKLLRSYLTNARMEFLEVKILLDVLKKLTNGIPRALYILY